MCEEITNVNGTDFQKNFKISGKPYIFDKDKNDFPAFTPINFERINFIIHHDSNYRPLKEDGSDSISETIKSRIWKDKNIEDYSCDYDDILEVVRVIDRLNSTRQSSLGPKMKKENNQESEIGRKVTAYYISTMKYFYERLKSGDPKLVDEIAKKAISTESIIRAYEMGKIKDLDVNEIKKNPVSRYTFSFASKYCTYMARAIFEKKKGEDGYCIFDKVMCDILPYYAWVYLKENHLKKKSSKIPEEFAAKGNGNYEGYRKLIDRIIQRAELIFGREYPKDPFYSISRKDFDHLLWYYFKGGNPKIKDAMKLVGNDSAVLK